DVEHDALRALEKDAPPGALRLVQEPPHRLGKRQNLGCDLDERGEQGRALDLGSAEATQQRVVMQQEMIELLGEAVGIGEIADADRAPPDLVLIGGADAAAGGADL